MPFETFVDIKIPYFHCEDNFYIQIFQIQIHVYLFKNIFLHSFQLIHLKFIQNIELTVNNFIIL